MQLSPGRASLRSGMRESSYAGFRPTPRLSGSEWAEKFYSIPRVGRWRWESAPYMRGIQRSMCDPMVRRSVVMKGNQIAGTTGGIIPALGYAVHQRPTRVLVYLPTESDAKKFSKDKLDPCFQATSELRGSIPSADDNLYEKRFPGGMILIQSGGTPRTYRQTDAEWVVFDDVDGFDREVGDEGDFFSLGEKRTRSYRRPKTIAVSTPTVKDFSKIEELFLLGNQMRYEVPCPHCRTRQELRWGGPDKDYGFKWDKEERDGIVYPVIESVAYLCASCGTLIEEKHKRAMLCHPHADWVVHAPDRSYWGDSFHLPQFVSLLPGAGWTNLLSDWVDAGDDTAKLQTFVNQVLAETWEDRGQKITTNELEDRAEVYVGSDGNRVEVPDGVGVITFGVDVQGDRYEILFKGYGVEGESWDIFHERVFGDPRSKDTQARLRALMLRSFRNEHGHQFRAAAGLVDSGYEAKMIYEFVRPLQSYNIWCVKGDKGAEQAEPIKAGAKKNAQGIRLWTLGTFPMKLDLFRRLKRTRPGPRFLHLRQGDPDFCNGFDANYFRQFGAEKLIPKGGKRTFQRLGSRPNEAIDLQNYADGAFLALGTSVSDHLQEWVDQARTPAPTEPPPVEPDEPDWATGGGRWKAW